MKKTLFLLFTLFTLLIPKSAKAYDIGLQSWNTDDLSIKWDKERAAFKFTLTVYDWYKQDEWLTMVKISCDDKEFVCIDSWFTKSNSTADFQIKKLNSLGEIYLDYHNWAKVTDNFTRYKQTKNNGDRAQIVFYWYPPASYYNTLLKFTLNGKTTDSGDDVATFTNTRIYEKSTTYEYTPTIENIGWNTNTGKYEFKITNIKNGDKYKWTTTWYDIETQHDNENWAHRGNIYKSTNTTNPNYTVSMTELVGYLNGKWTTNKASAEQFAEGAKIRIKTQTQPDSGSAPDKMSYEYSREIHTGYIAVITNNRTLLVEQTNENELLFSWCAYKPQGNNVNNNWVIEEELPNGQWSPIATNIKCKSNDNSYFHKLNIEERREDINRNFRLRNTMFKEGLWYEYLSSNIVNYTYSPYYKQFNKNATTYDINAKDCCANIKWEKTKKGIWNNNVKLHLEYYANNSLVKSIALDNSLNNYELQNLTPCTKYTVKIFASCLENNYNDSTYVEFIMPDETDHNINSFEATRGYYSNKVRLKWDVSKGNTFNYFNIYRRVNTDHSDNVFVTQIPFNSNTTTYSYEDVNIDAGTIYVYTITGYTNCYLNESGEEQTSSIGDQLTDYGFAQSYASVSGRVYFNGEQGVPGVDVAIVGSDDHIENYSLYLNGEKNSYISLPDDVIDFRNDNSITIQAYINPSYNNENNNDTTYLFAHKGIFEIALVKLDNSELFGLRNNSLPSNTFVDTIQGGKWTHLTWAINVDKVNNHVKTDYYSNGLLKTSRIITNLNTDSLSKQRDSIFYVGAYFDKTKNYKGFIDEIRVWNCILDSASVAKYYNRYLSGREKDLRAYYRCNEPGINIIFDISGKDELFNKRDGKLGTSVAHSATVVPSTEQLSNKAVTDSDGNYIINTIPYTNDGIQYNVIPLLGVHQFSPSKQPIFVSSSSSFFNKIDFIDKSSFKVKGKVYYEHSDYPVAGCQIKVDGVICTNNGIAIQTNTEGEFSIDIPIGEHYIEIVKDGHTFANNGRYPSDPENQGILFDFQEPINNLIFTDITKANIAGRIAGGEIEYKKPYGGRQSKANIGRAKIVLEASDLYSLNCIRKEKETSTSFEVNSTKLKLDSITSEINSLAYIGGGEESNRITIYTDSITGEFAVQVPPLQYKVIDLSIPSNEDIIFDIEAIKDIDARNVINVTIDTAVYHIDSTIIMRTLSYVDDLKIEYRSEPIFYVSQEYNNNGAFGEKQYIYKDEITNKKDTIALYEQVDNSINYTFGYPVFEQLNEYTFILEGYEEYINKDIKDAPEITRVPLEHTLVTITNEFGVEQAIDTTTKELWPNLEFNQLYLDSAGKAEYTFVVGFPNLAEPYTYGLNIKYEVNNKEYLWQDKPLNAIVLGNIPQGNQFVTGGPDVVTMILRDPPGSNSSSFFDEGTKAVTTSTHNWKINPGGGVNIITERTRQTSLVNGFWEGMGAGAFEGLIHQSSVGRNRDHNIALDILYNGSHTTTTTEIINKRISTSSTIGYIGAAGDIFIGNAVNLIFGEAKGVIITPDTANNKYKIVAEDIFTAGEQFATTFQYSQTYIVSSLIPNLTNLRNSLLITVSDTATINSTTNRNPIYITELTPDNPKFGADSTYKVIYPEDISNKLAHADSVSLLNSQINTWKHWLSVNEYEKVFAIENMAYNDKNNTNEDIEINDSTTADFIKKNYSFDSGASITETIQNGKDKNLTNTLNFTLNYKYNKGFKTDIRGKVLNCNLNLYLTLGLGKTWGNTDGTTTTTGFTLADTDLNNAYTVDVITSNMNGRSAIFYTRGGQTSCPYADVETTKFFEPGKHNLAEATIQIEKPQIRVENPFATDIPSGEAASFKILLDNLSATGTDLFYDLCVLDESNPNGARIAIDGEAIIGNHPIRIKANETMEKTIMLRQTDQSILEYKNIKLVLKSQCQGGLAFSKIIADTVDISATFTPSCSNVELIINNNILNTSTGASLPITIKNYNMNYSNFQGFRLQYKGERDTEWTLIEEWLLNPDQNSKAQLLNSSEIKYNFDMSDNAFMTNGKYLFRVITICNYGTGEINNESETIEIIKDMSRPMLFGTPSPTNGILTPSSEISVTFNEDIKSSSLTDTRNFVVEGRLNGYKVDHAVTMHLTGEATASTDTEINIPYTPFAINLWINYSNPGNITTHGNATNKFIIGIDDSDKLSVKINNSTYLSENTLPRNKWIFLSIAYDTINGGILTADYITDNYSTNLFNMENVEKYTSKSKLTIGGNISAYIHELTIWNYARTLTEAQSEMYETKYAGTPNLIGYWHMDEGKGSIAEDIINGHHLILPNSNAWHLENKNFAAELNGESSLVMNISTISPTPNEDYMLELWFYNSTKNQKATLLSNGLGFNISINNKGFLEYLTKDSTLLVAKNAPISLDTWQHLAINNRTNGSTLIYLNGEEILQIPTNQKANLAADHLVIGADRYHDKDSITKWAYQNYFIGIIDEIRLWKATLTSEYIRNKQNTRMHGDEAGLVAYYPFERTILNDFAQTETIFDLADHSTSSLEELKLTTSNSLHSTNNTPALKEIRLLENVEYSYTASERKIIIHIDEETNIIEGTTIFFTIRNVQDLNGNTANPISWTAYIKQNQLKWEEKTHYAEIQTNKQYHFTTNIINHSAQNEYWQIQNIPTWLSINKESGELNALSTETLSLSVSENLPIGNYEETIYLVGNNNIYEPFVINLSIIGEKPDWSVNPYLFEYSMSTIGILEFEGKISENENDIIAAFINDECVGVASPKYNSRYDRYFVLMDIYSNVNNELITFKAYEAATGNLYPIVEISIPNLRFESNRLINSMDDPFIWNAKDYLEQKIPLNKGWNWISLFVTPNNPNAKTLLETISPSLYVIKNKSKSIVFDGNQILGENITVNVGEKYRIKTKENVLLNVIGKKVNPTDYKISIDNKWNWIGYTASFNMSITDGFAGLNPQNGDIVKSKTQFATFNGYEWIGTLTTLIPGQGYQYYSKEPNQKEFTFPSQTFNYNSQHRVLSEETSEFTPVEENEYPSNMTLLAQVFDGTILQQTVEVAAFVGNECRGVVTSDENGYVCLTILGEGYGDVISFKVKIGNDIYNIKETIIYEDDAIIGTIEEPYIIQVSETNDLEVPTITSAKIYTNNGTLIIEGATEDYKLLDATGKLIYIGRQSQIQLPNGVYLIQLGDEIQKIVL